MMMLVISHYAGFIPDARYRGNKVPAKVRGYMPAARARTEVGRLSQEHKGKHVIFRAEPYQDAIKRYELRV